MTQVLNLLGQFLLDLQNHAAAHFVEYSPLVIALLLWLVSRSSASQKVLRSDGQRLQACVERVGSEHAGSH